MFQAFRFFALCICGVGIFGYLGAQLLSAMGDREDNPDGNVQRAKSLYEAAYWTTVGSLVVFAVGLIGAFAQRYSDWTAHAASEAATTAK